jgi:hypothetical protein
MMSRRWIVAPFWWTEQPGVIRRGIRRLEVSAVELELIAHWRHPATDVDVARELRRSPESVTADRSRLTTAGVIVPAAEARLVIPAVEIEISSVCNANCVMCPRDTLSRHRGFAHMHEELFDAVVRNLGGRGVPIYYLCGIGEPLLHPSWFRFAEQLRAADAKAEIICVTNGFSIRPKDLDRIIDSEIDVLEISLHSLDERAHHSIMRSFPVHRALERVSALLTRLAQRPDATLGVKIGQVLVASHPKPDPGLAAWARARGLEFNAWRTWNRAGHVRDHVLADAAADAQTFADANHNPATCSDYAEMLFIDHEGEVLACCCDFANETAEFNAAGHTLEEILAGRLRQLASGRPLSPICHRCDAPATNKPFWATDFFRLTLP